MPPSRRPRAGRRLAVAKLADFGGARLAGEDALTRTGDVLGTLAYMAPEQSEGHEVGPSADLYSLALVLYEAFSGVNPVRGRTPAATARQDRRTDRAARASPPRSPARADPRARRGVSTPTPKRRGTLAELHDAFADALDRGVETPTVRSATDAGPVGCPTGPGAAVSEVAATRYRCPRPQATRPSPCGLAAGVVGRMRARRCRLAGGSGPCGRVAAAAGGWRPVVGLASPLGSRVACGGVGAGARARRPGGRFSGACRSARRAGARGRALAVLGFWWLALAEPLLAKRLWLGPPSGLPPRAVWEASLGKAATHVVGATLTIELLLGAAVWALASMVLPWIVRGRSAALDVVAAVVWTVALLAAVPLLDHALLAHAGQPSPRGALLGAVFGCVLAVCARALRGPV